jgi:Lipid A 3-O-deacylase (PagL).
MRLRRAAAICAATLAVAGPAGAGEWRIGVGYDDVLEPGEGHATLGAELQGGDLLTLGPAGLALGVAARIDADGEFWAGAGPVLRIETGLMGLRAEASVMPGVYNGGDDGDDLGGPFEIRSTIGLSLPVWGPWRLGAEFNHISNAGLHEENPGVDSVLVSVGRSF